MYNFSLILGLLFAVYVVILVYLAINKRRERTITPSTSLQYKPMVINDKQDDLIPHITAKEDGEGTVITWRTPANKEFVSVKIYARGSNNPAAAVSRLAVPKSDNEFESIRHNRNGKRHWYWITLLYQNGTESEKQFIDVVPNTDD